MVRAPCCEKAGLRRGRWTEEEDDILLKYIQQNGEGSWKTLPKNAGLLRCGKSCRLRWINYLRAGLKRGNISEEEEETIIKLHSSLGKRWSTIASHLPGRTDNEIKNYWNTHLSRRVHSFRRLPDGETVTINLGSFLTGSQHRRSRNSHATMKKLAFTVASTIKKEQNQNHSSNKITHTNSNLSIASHSFTQTENARSNDTSNDPITADFNIDFDEVFDDEIISAALQPPDHTFVSNKAETREEKWAKKGKELGCHDTSEGMLWDLERLEAILWEDESSDMWPWQCDLSGMTGYDEDAFSWFLS